MGRLAGRPRGSHTVHAWWPKYRLLAEIRGPGPPVPVGDWVHTSMRAAARAGEPTGGTDAARGVVTPSQHGQMVMPASNGSFAHQDKLLVQYYR